MDHAEVMARIAVHQSQADQAFDFDKFIDKEVYFANYPEERKEYFDTMKRKRSSKGKTMSIAEEHALTSKHKSQ